MRRPLVIPTPRTTLAVPGVFRGPIGTTRSADDVVRGLGLEKAKCDEIVSALNGPPAALNQALRGVPRAAAISVINRAADYRKATSRCAAEPMRKSLFVHRLLVPDHLGALLWDACGLMKGAGHKYIRRVPTGNPKRPWRYYYTVAGGKGLGHESEFQIGAAFKVAHGGKDGHFRVVAVKGDRVQVRHDETGHEEWVEKRALSEMLHREHATKLSAHRARVRRDLEDVAKHGTEHQKKAVKKRAAQYGHTEHMVRDRPMTRAEKLILARWPVVDGKPMAAFDVASDRDKRGRKIHRKDVVGRLADDHFVSQSGGRITLTAKGKEKWWSEVGGHRHGPFASSPKPKPTRDDDTDLFDMFGDLGKKPSPAPPPSAPAQPDLDATITRKPVTSSNLASVGHDPRSNTLEVEFRNGTVYRYGGISATTAKELANAESPGRWLNSRVKGAAVVKVRSIQPSARTRAAARKIAEEERSRRTRHTAERADALIEERKRGKKGA